MALLKYTKEVLENAVKNSNTFRQTAIYLGCTPHGGTIEYITHRIKHFSIDTSHFRGRGLGKGWSKGISPVTKKLPKDILIKYPVGSFRQKAFLLRRAMFESGIIYRCNTCHTVEWMGRKINLEVNHIDGDFTNCLLINLEFLCPNCHSQTSKYKNYGKYPNGEDVVLKTAIP